MINEWFSQKANEVQNRADNNDQRGLFEGIKSLGKPNHHAVNNAALKANNGQTQLKTLEERKIGG